MIMTIYNPDSVSNTNKEATNTSKQKGKKIT